MERESRKPLFVGRYGAADGGRDVPPQRTGMLACSIPSQVPTQELEGHPGLSSGERGTSSEACPRGHHIRAGGVCQQRVVLAADESKDRSRPLVPTAVMVEASTPTRGDRGRSGVLTRLQLRESFVRAALLGPGSTALGRSSI